jgi:hypothetical protein
MKRFQRIGVAAVVVLAMMAGCAPSQVQQEKMDLKAFPKPDLILVYDFAVSPEEVHLDKGLSAELKQKYEQHKGQSRTAQEIKIGHKVADVVAEELVKNIRTQGLWAQRGFAPPHGNRQMVLIKGQFLSIDEGNRTERVTIGLGAGRTDVQANVQLYDVTHEGLKELDALRGDSKSSYKPGMAEMMGVGSLAGHLLTSTVVSGALAGGTEMTVATVQADGKRLADKIASELGQYFVDQGWILPKVEKKSIF